MLNYKNRILALFIIAALLSVSFTVVHAQDECNFEGEPIRIGATGPLSAPGTVLAGIDMQWAFNIAEADLNAPPNCGIELDGVQHPVEVIFGDTEGLPERGAAVADRLINENGVVALTGEYHSAVGLSMMDVAVEANIPTVFSETFSDQITAQQAPNTFRIAPTSTIASSAISEWLISLEPEDVVIIAENTDFGTGIAESTQANLEAAGVNVEVIFVELGTQDFLPILSRIQAGDPPDAIHTTGVTGETNLNLVQQMAELGLAPTEDTICIANQVAITPEFWETVPDGNYCVFRKIGLGPASYNEIAQSLADRYNETFGSAAQSWVFESYDSLFIIADAIERAGSTDPDAVIEALEATDITLAQGRYYFPFGLNNPVPEDVPEWMWHQWPDPAVTVLQYFEEGQSGDEAAILWPEVRQTHGTSYIVPGTTP
ncbi:MAG: ABC transporter substrate-binding protein [Chloroflexi bacterium]|nr:MAG: ABC transporter substrate-binding protein [Phototrophicales bacterium]RMF78763.1 MAG: ABC transporter substrate-binding protein [Chloroflexota bacterium]